jgi:hypothetical protein
MTEGNYSNVGHRGPVYKGLSAMNLCDNLQILVVVLGVMVLATAVTAWYVPLRKRKPW